METVGSTCCISTGIPPWLFRGCGMPCSPIQVEDGSRVPLLSPTNVPIYSQYHGHPEAQPKFTSFAPFQPSRLGAQPGLTSYYTEGRPIIESSPRSAVNSNALVPLLQLPLDIIFLISAHLPIANRALCALTCRDLFRLRPIEPMNASDIFNSLIEREMPRFYYDFGSCRLLRSEPKWTVQDYKRSIPPTRRGYRLSAKRGDYELFYHLAHFVMKRHFYGQSHGLPLSALNYEDKITYEKTDLSERWSARILQDELYLRAECRWYNYAWDFVPLRSLVYGWICKHGEGAGQTYTHSLGLLPVPSIISRN
ncbi:hypothetical protein BJ170DRAFT_35244 [Xylariales sp. AK1849]|nr:hypothetical protein BJ170DRAFT_35244 [Xylariales sp. AK1849]